MVEQVTIDTSGETSGPTLEEQAAAMDAAAAEQAGEAPAQERRSGSLRSSTLRRT